MYIKLPLVSSCRMFWACDCQERFSSKDELHTQKMTLLSRLLPWSMAGVSDKANLETHAHTFTHTHVGVVPTRCTCNCGGLSGLIGQRGRFQDPKGVGFFFFTVWVCVSPRLPHGLRRLPSTGGAIRWAMKGSSSLQRSPGPGLPLRPLLVDSSGVDGWGKTRRCDLWWSERQRERDLHKQPP